MTLLIINALLYSIALVVYYRKYRNFNVGALLLSIYVTAAWFSVALYSHDDFEYSIHYGDGDLRWGVYVYLFATLMIFFYPVLRFNSAEVKEYRQPYIKRYYFLSYILFGASILYIIIYLPFVVKGLSGDIAMNRDTVMETGLQVVDNPLLSIFIRVYGALSSISLLLSFYGIIFLKKRRLFAVLFFLTSVSAPIVTSFSYSGRADIIFLLMSVGFMYILFYRFIGSRLKKRINIISLVSIGGLSVIGYIITVARFGEVAFYSMNYFLLKYPGESFINFNSLLFGKTTGMTYGYTNFPLFRRLLGLEYFKTLIDKRLYVEQVTSVPSYIFYQFVGNIYLDFGAIGTLLVAAFVGWMGWMFIKSGPVVGIHHALLLALLFDIYAHGVFFFPLAHEPGNLRIIFAGILYQYFKYGQKEPDMRQISAGHGISLVPATEHVKHDGSGLRT